MGQSELAEKKMGVDGSHGLRAVFAALRRRRLLHQDAEFNIAAIAHYVKALDIRMKAHRMVALFAGRVPHAIGLVAGGMAKTPDKAAWRRPGPFLRK